MLCGIMLGVLLGMLGIIMHWVVLLNVFMLSGITLSVVMLNVMALPNNPSQLFQNTKPNSGHLRGHYLHR